MRSETRRRKAVSRASASNHNRSVRVSLSILVSVRANGRVVYAIVRRIFLKERKLTRRMGQEVLKDGPIRNDIAGGSRVERNEHVEVDGSRMESNGAVAVEEIGSAAMETVDFVVVAA